MSENKERIATQDMQHEGVFEEDDRLNETCTASFEVPGYVSFHFKPAVAPGGNMALVMKEYRQYRAGLQELAERLNTSRMQSAKLERYAAARYVAVTSWIVNNNESILTGAGFVEDGAMSSDEKTALIRVYKERQGRDNVRPEHRDIEPKCLRIPVELFIQRHLKRS